ncbi:MAG: hypothetical protein ACJ74D_09365 [Gaiellaceae bacterium]
MTRLLVLLVTFLAIGAAPALASERVDVDATGLKLAVNRSGTAMVTYRARGRLFHLLAWGAINARPPSRAVRQVHFRFDWSGGWKSRHRLVWKTFRDQCTKYDGPPLVYVVAACKAPDGSYWALQNWQTALPGLGFAPWLYRQKEWWLHLSHWSGDPAKLDVYQDWVYSRHIEEVFGQYTYRGVGVRGFGTTHWGAPTDNFGRLLYLDTHNSRYGRGWKREEAFVSSGPPGIFCFGFFRRDPYINGHPHPPGAPHKRRGPAHGDQYRITAVGPGVTPDVVWHGPGLHAFNRSNPNDVALEDAMNARLDQMRGSWHKCHQH